MRIETQGVFVFNTLHQTHATKIMKNPINLEIITCDEQKYLDMRTCLNIHLHIQMFSNFI